MSFVAARYTGDPQIEIAPDPWVDPGPGEVAIAVAYAGICGTDLHIVHGDMDHRIPEPRPIGHEMSGVIRAVGPGVAHLETGQPVTVMPYTPCGKCPTCEAGRLNVCPNLDLLGIDAPGAIRNVWVVPAAVVHPLPHGLDLRLGALVEPLAVATHDVRRAGSVTGQRVVVLGGGPVGALVALVAGADGAEVIVAEPAAERRAALQRIGITVVAAGEACLAHVDEWTGGLGADLVFEVSGSQGGAEALTQLLRPRGIGVVVGIHPKPRAVDLFQYFWKELTVLGARIYESEDFARAIQLLDSKALDPEPLITDVYPLPAVNDAIARLDRGAGAMKLLIDCRT